MSKLYFVLVDNETGIQVETKIISYQRGENVPLIKQNNIVDWLHEIAKDSGLFSYRIDKYDSDFENGNTRVNTWEENF